LDKKQKQTAYSSDSYRHRTENNDGYEWNTLIRICEYRINYSIDLKETRAQKGATPMIYT